VGELLQPFKNFAKVGTIVEKVKVVEVTQTWDKAMKMEAAKIGVRTENRESLCGQDMISYFSDSPPSKLNRKFRPANLWCDMRNIPVRRLMETTKSTLSVLSSVRLHCLTTPWDHI